VTVTVPNQTSTDRRLVATMVVATVACVYPGFLVGAVSVQVSDDFGVTAGRYGWAMSSYFLAATATSVLGGRLVQRIGPRRQLSGCLMLTIVTQSLIATTAQSFPAMVGLLAVCGVVNALNQTAVNLALTTARLPRLGLAIALKQSGMPSAAMVSGATVPLLALTLGWRSTFVLGVVLASVALVLVQFFVGRGSVETLRSARPSSSRRALGWSLVGGSFLAFAAGGLTSWTVASGVEAGLSEGVAGWMLSLGAAFGIGWRLFWGVRTDTMGAQPYAMAAGLAALGSIGTLGLAFGGAGIHVASTFLAFGAGWAWPVFTNFGIMRANGAAAGSASGVTQMGIYLGVFAGPLTTGWMIDRYGFGAMWLLVGTCMLIGAALTFWIREEF